MQTHRETLRRSRLLQDYIFRQPPPSGLAMGSACAVLHAAGPEHSRAFLGHRVKFSICRTVVRKLPATLDPSACLPSAMIRKEISRSYQELNDETEQGSGGAAILEDMEEEDNDDQGDTGSTTMPDQDTDRNSPSIRFSRTCLKNVFSVLLIFVYLSLMAVAVFIVYQTITDFREKLKHPVMSVSYKEVNVYDAPGIALYPGNAELLSCEHHFYDHIPKLKNPGQPGENKCVTRKINYTDPFTNQTMKNALIVEGPRDVRKRELVYLQFHLNETKQDFSAIDYLLFSSYQNFLKRAYQGLLCSMIGSEQCWSVHWLISEHLSMQPGAQSDWRAAL